MNRQALIAEATAAGEAAVHNLKLIRKEPERIVEGKVKDAEDYLIMISRMAKEEKKNAWRAGQTSLRSRLRTLVLILTQNVRAVKK